MQGIKFEEASDEVKAEINKHRKRIYSKVTIELDGINASASQEMRTKHYDSVITTLIDAVQEHWAKEASGELSMDDNFEIGSNKEMSPDWKNIIGPKRRNRRQEEDAAFREKYINALSANRHMDLTSRIIVDNIYRDVYKIPKNLKVRPPDKWIERACEDLYVNQRTQKLQKYSVDPNLIFFSHDMEDEDVGYCIRKLHGDHITDEPQRKIHCEKLNKISSK